MNDTLIVNIDGQQRTIDLSGCTNAEQVNVVLGANGVVGMRALTHAEAEAISAQHNKERRAALIKEIGDYPHSDVKRALADVGRKGWGLDWLALEKLETIASMLRPDVDD